MADRCDNLASLLHQLTGSFAHAFRHAPGISSAGIAAALPADLFLPERGFVACCRRMTMGGCDAAGISCQSRGCGDARSTVPGALVLANEGLTG